MIGPMPSQICGECSKEIHDDEWVVNWGSCNECFNRHYNEFEKEMLKVNLKETDWLYEEPK